MKTRAITAFLIIACVIPPLLLGGIWIQALLAFIIIAGGIELLDLKEGDAPLPVFIKPLAIASVFLLLLLEEKLRFPGMGVVVLLFLSIPIFTERFHAKDSFLCISYIAVFFLIADSFITIYEMNPLYIWFLLMATYSCDTGAYFCGRFLGKHKLNKRISPKKTWEGSIGGWIIGTLAAVVFGYLTIDSMSLAQMVLAAGILTITGQIGDLAFSAIKRMYHIKDFSNLLPGHGGVLDRIDSLVFNFVCFHFILVVVML